MSPCVDVCFRVLGGPIPSDHAYALYSAIARLLPALHGDKEVGIHAINGRNTGDRLLALTGTSRLTLRIAYDRIGDVLPLAGKALALDGHTIQVGIPATRALVPGARLYSRLVVIKGFTEPQPFLEAVGRQLVEMGIRGKPSLVDTASTAASNQGRSGGTRSPFLRRTFCIHDKNIVGFAVRVEELTAAESIMLQEQGLGGRRRFGCGVFVADTERR